MKPLIKVTAAIILKNNKVLIAQRKQDDPFKLKWEFPGGKIEKDETPEKCLNRELTEELGISAEIGELFLRVFHSYPDFDIELLAYQVNKFSNKPKNNTHQKLSWVAVGNLPAFDFLEADIPVIKKLQSIH
ncbi:MAG: 8-oxo-dGTP diphosphatase MutT [Candidatus Margulisbacteria bacterium]|nr:8-oxo-dGTP diphosphatase MutT [Candidatus Margulisiibacteriota bacterium]